MTFIQRLLGCCPPIRSSGASVRSKVLGTPYIVAYRVRDTRIEVLFVQYGAREWPDDI